MLGRQTWLRSGKRTGVGVSGRAKLRRILGYDDRSGSLAHFAVCWRWAEKAEADVATALQARTMTRLDYKCSATSEYDSCMLCYILDFHLTNTLYILLSSYTKLVLLLASGTKYQLEGGRMFTCGLSGNGDSQCYRQFYRN